MKPVIPPKALDLELRFGEPHNALWADSEDRHQEAGPDAQVFGIVLGIRFGTFINTFHKWGAESSILSENYKPTDLFRFPFVFPWLSP